MVNGFASFHLCKRGQAHKGKSMWQAVKRLRRGVGREISEKKASRMLILPVISSVTPVNDTQVRVDTVCRVAK